MSNIQETEKVRLQKYIADCGLMSRRAAEAEIEAGHVKVNGVVATIGTKIVPGKDKVAVNGRGVNPRSDVSTVVALNKPRGYVCTASDEKDRKTVTELVSDLGLRLYPVGRLDMASEGLILLTDDGEFANLMMHPRHHIPKIYRVSVKGIVDERRLEILKSSIEIDGRQTVPANVAVLEHTKDGAKLEFILFEGRNRQIRRLCEAAGLSVSRLRRTHIGGLSVNGIAPGHYRKLSEKEIADLKGWAKNGMEIENDEA